jgi:hypothetical protein
MAPDLGRQACRAGRAYPDSPRTWTNARKYPQEAQTEGLSMPLAEVTY